MSQIEIKVFDKHANQENEMILIKEGATERSVWLHDYDLIYKTPGLYEKIFIELFGGVSHQLIPKMLLDVATKRAFDAGSMRVIDLGAGVGLVGEYLRQNRVENIYGIDITDSAKQAADRDRPNIYTEYLISDLTLTNHENTNFLERASANCLICVSSLNVVPAKAWSFVFNSISLGGLIGLNIVEGALNVSSSDQYETGSNALIRYLLDAGCLKACSTKVYQHRLSSSGEPINYVAVVAEKVRDITLSECEKYERRTW